MLCWRQVYRIIRTGNFHDTNLHGVRLCGLWNEKRRYTTVLYSCKSPHQYSRSVLRTHTHTHTHTHIHRERERDTHTYSSAHRAQPCFTLLDVEPTSPDVNPFPADLIPRCGCTRRSRPVENVHTSSWKVSGLRQWIMVVLGKRGEGRERRCAREHEHENRSQPPADRVQHLPCTIILTP